MNDKRLKENYFDNIRGAVYISAHAFNAYQMWKDYSSEETLRDIGYAKSLGLNSLRLWVSYEYWKEDRDAFKARFDHFLDSASKVGILTMPSLFEDCGRENSNEAMNDKNVVTATAFKSPGTEITSDKSKWEDCREYIIWFMNNYKNDERLLAIEIMNEPHIMPKNENLSFARDMFKVAREHSGNVPLTIGCISLEHNLYFMEYGLDILQFHDNFPKSLDEFETKLHIAKETEKILGKPVWITEWQRIRSNGPGWDVQQIPYEDTVPDLASIAGYIKKYNIGNFFWSLMLKVAYLPAQRPNGTFNGIFHEDGAVYSIADARAVAQDISISFEERKSKPE